MISMFDSVTVSELPSGSGYAYAGYTGGNWPTYKAVVAKFPGHQVLSVAVNASEIAQALDVEAGDATPGQAPGWYSRMRAAGVSRPCFYASVSNMQQVINSLEDDGIARANFRLWSAHYDGQHLCGPSSCGEVRIAMDGTQWTDTALGRNLDESLLVANFFGAAAPTPAPGPTTIDAGAILATLPILASGANDSKLSHRYVARVQTLCNLIENTGLKIDGVYGATTVAAVKKVQTAYKLSADGVTGADTWKVLVCG